jgi:putative oxidoreductase
MELPWLSRWQPQLLAVLRIVAGLLFLEHATQKFFAFPVPFPLQPLPPLFVAAGVIELVAGTLVTIGLFTRLAAFIASGEMAVGYFMIHFPKSPWPAANMGEAAILFSFIFLYLAGTGSGAWSVDEARLRNAPIR